VALANRHAVSGTARMARIIGGYQHQTVIESNCKNRSDIFFIPAESFWKLKRILKAAYFYNIMKSVQDIFHKR
ncbi:MAG: hypothetical protein ACKOCO_02310, partial [Bacteroidota bacterium]